MVPSGDPDARPPPRARRGLGAVGRTVLLAIAVVAAFFAGLAGVALVSGDDPEGDETLPGATLEGFGDGPPVATADYAGEPLVVNFWATWCPPCVEEMPDLQRVHEAVGHEVALLGVNVRDAPSNAEPFVDELGITYDLAVDADGDYYREVGSEGMPTTLVVAADGAIVARRTGALTAEELLGLLADEFGARP